jgi:hypothetical protein
MGIISEYEILKHLPEPKYATFRDLQDNIGTKFYFISDRTQDRNSYNGCSEMVISNFRIQKDMFTYVSINKSLTLYPNSWGLDNREREWLDDKIKSLSRNSISSLSILHVGYSILKVECKYKSNTVKMSPGVVYDVVYIDFVEYLLYIVDDNGLISGAKLELFNMDKVYRSLKLDKLLL